ncbi:hypothetical protein CJU90_6291 [Yarrowia sp. C11]|nr:hypothetical protein CJU90_6291 [Yarrowia sp. C11]
MERRGRLGIAEELDKTQTAPVGASSGSSRSTNPTSGKTPAQEVEYIDPEDLEQIMDQMGFVKDGDDRWELVEQVEDDDDEDWDQAGHYEDEEEYRVAMEKRRLLQQKEQQKQAEPKIDFQNSREFMEGSVGFLTLLLVLSMVGFLTITFVFVEKEWKEGDWMLLPILPLEAAGVVFGWYRGSRIQVGLVQVLGFSYKLRHPLLAVLMTVFLLTNQACLAGIVLIKRKISAQYGPGPGGDKEEPKKENAGVSKTGGDGPDGESEEVPQLVSN